jgi:hypothetical protein|tara:strand:+ start:258 stop:488 length:231 start_codon:yes stop_codon:yes gene_type:complete
MAKNFSVDHCEKLVIAFLLNFPNKYRHWFDTKGCKWKMDFPNAGGIDVYLTVGKFEQFVSVISYSFHIVVNHIGSF